MAADPDPPDRAIRLLLALREHGFAVETVKVGDVELAGVRDFLPHPKARLEETAAQQRDERSTGPGGYAHEFGADLMGDGAPTA